ncbi:MAG TPA: ATP-binding protein [Terriglobales bacterium]|nr:ATP-binding protein [Terriglobales bacterium]
MREANPRASKKVLEEIQQLKLRLSAAEEALAAVRDGHVDAIVVPGPHGAQVFTLAGSDAAYRVFVERMKEGAVTIGADGTVFYCNHAFADIVDYPLDHVIGRSIYDFVPKPERARFDSVYQHPLDGPPKIELQLLKSNGDRVPVFVSANIFQESSTSVCMVITDLTEQKMQDEIVSAGRLAHLIVQQAAEAIAVCDNTGRVVLASQAFHNLCGKNTLLLPFEMVLPLQFSDGDQLSAESFSLRSVLEGKAYRGAEVVFRQEDGEPTHLLMSAARLKLPSDATSGAVITLFDIEERKRTEEYLRRSERLAATGRLAATIAHEINNPLAAVTNLLYLLSSDPKLDGSLKEYAQVAQAEISRVAHITKQTLAFHRDTNMPVRVNLNDIMESVLYLFSQQLRVKSIRVHKEMDFNGDVIGFPNELRQVISNIFENAIEAAPEAGKVRLRVYTSREYMNSHKPGVRIVVADDGPGIRHENAQKIFEPFFTTKGEKGTGLGLWVCQGIIHKHGGYIRMKSSTHPRHSGTVFSIFLPTRGSGVGMLSSTA